MGEVTESKIDDDSSKRIETDHKHFCHEEAKRFLPHDFKEHHFSRVPTGTSTKISQHRRAAVGDNIMEGKNLRYARVMTNHLEV